MHLISYQEKLQASFLIFFLFHSREDYNFISVSTIFISKNYLIDYTEQDYTYPVIFNSSQNKSYTTRDWTTNIWQVCMDILKNLLGDQ